MSPSRRPASWPDRNSAEEAFGGCRRPGTILGRAGLVILVDPRRHHISLAPGCDLFADSLPRTVQPRGLVPDEDRVGGDRLTPARQFAQRGRLQVAIDGECDRARYRRRGHHQQMRGNAVRGLGAQPISLLDAEPVLLVDHHHAQLVKFHRVLQQCVGADHDAGLAAGNFGPDLFLRAAVIDPVSSPPGWRSRLHPADRPSPARPAPQLSMKDVVQQVLPLERAARIDSRRRPSAAWPAPRRSSCPTRPHLAADG